MKQAPVHLLTMLIILFVFFWLFIERATAETVKIGEGPFVMAVSYTESYDDLEYVANFMSCAEAEKFYYANCLQAPIMMCQLEEHIYMPMDHDTTNNFSSFDFEVTAQQSCGFVKTQEGYSTFVEED